MPTRPRGCGAGAVAASGAVTGSTVIRIPGSGTGPQRHEYQPSYAATAGSPSVRRPQRRAAVRSRRSPSPGPTRRRPRRPAGPRPARPPAIVCPGWTTVATPPAGRPSTVASQVTSSPSLTVSAVSGADACGSCRTLRGPQRDQHQRGGDDDRVGATDGHTDDEHGEPDDRRPEVRVGRAPAGHRHLTRHAQTRSRAVGAGTCPSTVSTTVRPEMSVIQSSGRIVIRWASAGTATALTSSGTT